MGIPWKTAAAMGTAAVIAAGCAPAATASATAAVHRAKPPACVGFTIAWRTATGHEVDDPTTVCGTGLALNQYCTVKGTVPFGQPGSEVSCYGLRG